ncbi:MAG: ribonuclease J [Patescibacteria group bacterium]|nr:ribonuclease J [Patescibacteria group bacterium]
MLQKNPTRPDGPHPSMPRAAGTPNPRGRHHRQGQRSAPRRRGVRAVPAAAARTEIIRAQPPAAGRALRIIPLGGQEEVGRNCTVFEYGNDIVVLDVGLQFPEEDMPGIDYIIPNISYLKGKESRIRGVILSHGHLDHIGAVPHILPQLGWPPVYGSKLTLALVRKRLEEGRLAHHLRAHEIKSTRDQLQLGSLRVNFFDVTHSIMDAIGVIVSTPDIAAIHMGDWRYDLEPVAGRPTDFSHLNRFNTRRRPTILMMESLGSTKEGHQGSEREVYANLRRLIVNAPGRIIIATFSSMLERVGQIIGIAEGLGKKVALDGFSMKTNVEIGKRIGYLKFKPTTVVDISRIHSYPADRVIVICTGAQGEDRAVLMRIASGEHRYLKIEPKDTVVFSSSVIPGNERAIQRLKDTLYRQGAEVYHKEIMDVHTGGHAFIEDIKLLLLQIRPRYLMPVYANHYLLREAAKVATSIGFPGEDIFVLDNGNVLEAGARGVRILKEKIPTDYVFVDGLGVGDISHVVLRDRQMMSEDGMIVVIATVDRRRGKLVHNPDLISRGFVHMKENRKLIEQTRDRVKQMFAGNLKDLDENYYKDQIRNEVGEFLYSKTQRRPMVLPVIIQV